MSKLADRRRADAERNEAAILDAAVELLGREPTASMAAVADAAGVTRQTVYAHFPSRGLLLRVAVARATDDALVAGDRVAARYTLRAELRKGAAVATEIHMFGELAPDGRLRRIDQLTRPLPAE